MNGKQFFLNSVINVFDNSYTEGVSGGNVRGVQIFKNIKKVYPKINLRIVGSEKCKVFYRDFGLFTETLVTSKEKNVGNFFWVYFCRICTLILWVITSRFKRQTIYANSDYLVDVLPAFLNRVLFSSPWIQVCQLIIDHPAKRENSFTNYIAYYLQRFSFLLMKKANLVITDGYEIRDVLVDKFKFNPLLVQVGFLGIDLEAINEASPVEDAIDLAFVGTFDKRKGARDFIDICGELTNEGVDLKALVIGDTEDKITEFYDIMQKYGISSKINFTGKLNHSKIFSFLKSSKIFLFPSYNESWGLVICEAMACGALPIVRNLNAYKKIYYDNVIYCDSNEDFKTKAKFYLKHDNLRRELTNKAKIFISRYSWEAVAKREMDLFSLALNN